MSHRSAWVPPDPDQPYAVGRGVVRDLRGAKAGPLTMSPGTTRVLRTSDPYLLTELDESTSIGTSANCMGRIPSPGAAARSATTHKQAAATATTPKKE